MGLRNLEKYQVQIIVFLKIRANHDKKSSKFIKKITHADDMMIHNLVKYLVQTQLCLWDIKIINFKSRSCQHELLEIYYFYILQTKSSLDGIFYKLVYHHINYMCDFFHEFRWIFCRGLHGFSRRLWFSPDMFPLCFHSYSTIANVDTDSDHRNKFSLNQNHGIYPFWRPAMQPWIYKIYVFSVLITKIKTDVLAPRGKVDDLIHLPEA